MQKYTWAVWKQCRMVGYVQAYSEWDAMKIAKNRFGTDIFIERKDFATCNT